MKWENGNIYLEMKQKVITPKMLVTITHLKWKQLLQTQTRNLVCLLDDYNRQWIDLGAFLKLSDHMTAKISGPIVPHIILGKDN